MKRLVVAFVAMFVSVGVAQADIAVGPNISTLGYGAEVPVKLNGTFVMRFEGNFFDYSGSVATGDMNYSSDVSFRTFGAMLDFHPFGNGLMLSGGLYYNGNEINLSASPIAGATINGTAYTGAELGTIDGKLDFGTFSPFLGFGYDNTFYTDWKLSLSLRVGVMMMQGASVSLSSSGALASDATFKSDLATEEKKIQDALDEFGFFPVVSLGIRYRF